MDKTEQELATIRERVMRCERLTALETQRLLSLAEAADRLSLTLRVIEAHLGTIDNAAAVEETELEQYVASKVAKLVYGLAEAGRQQTRVLGEEAWAEEALTCDTKASMVTLLRAFAANMKVHRRMADSPSAPVLPELCESYQGKPGGNCTRCGLIAYEHHAWLLKMVAKEEGKDFAVNANAVLPEGQPQNDQVSLNRRIVNEGDSCVCTPGSPCKFHEISETSGEGQQ